MFKLQCVMCCRFGWSCWSRWPNRLNVSHVSLEARETQTLLLPLLLLLVLQLLLLLIILIIIFLSVYFSKSAAIIANKFEKSLEIKETHGNVSFSFFSSTSSSLRQTPAIFSSGSSSSSSLRTRGSWREASPGNRVSFSWLTHLELTLNP